MTDIVDAPTVFLVVRAGSHEAAAQLFVGHPHMTVFPCDGVEVMPLLGTNSQTETAALSAPQAP